MNGFFHFTLRTTDVAAARSFYRAILGDRDVDIVPLPDAARTRGAPPHWVGHIGVNDVETAVTAFVERGALRLGPTLPGAVGEFAVIRDPGGAVVALATHRARPRIAEPASAQDDAFASNSDVAWYLLYTTDVSRSTAAYCELLDWHLTDRMNLGALGVHQQFAWSPGGQSVGAIVDVTASSGIHAHWLYFFSTSALDEKTAAVRAAGGTVIGPMALPNGDRIAACEDPQGGAFALYEAAG